MEFYDVLESLLWTSDFALVFIPFEPPILGLVDEVPGTCHHRWFYERRCHHDRDWTAKICLRLQGKRSHLKVQRIQLVDLRLPGYGSEARGKATCRPSLWIPQSYLL